MLRVIGTTVVESGDEVVSLRPRERDVLAALALCHPSAVGQAELAGLLWNAPPASDTKTLQNHVARVRRVLGPSAVRTIGSSYALDDAWHTDLTVFREACAAARRAASVDDHRGARLHLEQALALVRGEPFADLEATAGVRAERRRWVQAISDAADDHLLALLRLDEVAAAMVAARALAVGVRERRALIVSLAMYSGGRRLDALRVLHGCRQALRDAGLRPSEPLLRLERALLADDPRVAAEGVASFIDVEPSVGQALGASILVGRSGPLSMIDAVLAGQFAGLAGCPPVVVTGPTGIGKSALCARVGLQARLAGWTVADCVRPLNGAEVAAITAADPSRPLLVIADDVDAFGPHDWAELAAACGPRILVLAACATAPACPATVIALEPLDREAVEQLVEVTLGVGRGSAPMAFVDAVVAGSGSVPALVMELTIDGGEILDGAGLARRLVEGLSPQARTVAAMVAVATVPVAPRPLLQACARAGVGGAERDIAENIARRVLLEDSAGQLVCRDEELRTELLAGVGPDAVRAARRAWVAQHDADGGAPLAVADHIAELPDWPVDDAIDRFDAARDLANALVEFETVDLNARRALRLAIGISGPDHPDVLRREIDITWFSKVDVELAFSDEQWQLVDRLRGLGDHSNLVRLAGLVIPMIANLEVDNHDPRLVSLIDEALSLPVDRALRSTAASAATDLFSLSDIDRCRRYAELAYSDAVAVGSDMLLIEAIESLSVALGHPDDWPRRTSLGLQAISLAERLDDGLKRGGATMMVFRNQLQMGDPLCRATLDRMRWLAERHERPGYRFAFGFMEASLLHVEGRLEECEATLEESALTVPLAQSRMDAVVFAELFAVRVAQHRIAEMRDPIARLAHEQPRFGLWQGYRCWIEASIGDHATAARLLDEIDDGAALPPTISWAAAAYSAARAAALIGDVARCRRVYALLAPHAGLMGWMGSGIIGPIDLALGELQLAIGDAAAAAEHLLAAERQVRLLHAPVFEPQLASLADRLG